jgi:hypothetical protein
MARSLLPLPEVPDFAARIGADLDKLKWLLWHGNTFRADQVLSWLEDDLYTDPAENPSEAQVKLARYVTEFATYIRANTHLIPNYGKRHRRGGSRQVAAAQRARDAGAGRRHHQGPVRVLPRAERRGSAVCSVYWCAAGACPRPGH